MTFPFFQKMLGIVNASKHYKKSDIIMPKYTCNIIRHNFKTDHFSTKE